VTRRLLLRLRPHVPGPRGWLSTTDGGKPAPGWSGGRGRQLVELVIRASEADDLGRIADRLARLGGLGGPGRTGRRRGPGAGPPAPAVVVVRILAADGVQARALPPAYNGPGRILRSSRRADAVARSGGGSRPAPAGSCRPRPPADLAASKGLFRRWPGLFGFSDYISDRGAFLRCSGDHHNVLIPRPRRCLSFITPSWEVDDVDEIGRGPRPRCSRGIPNGMCGGWAAITPAPTSSGTSATRRANFSEYFSDMDCNLDDQLWSPEVFEGREGLYAWGPPPPAIIPPPR